MILDKGLLVTGQYENLKMLTTLNFNDDDDENLVELEFLERLNEQKERERNYNV